MPATTEPGKLGENLLLIYLDRLSLVTQWGQGLGTGHYLRKPSLYPAELRDRISRGQPRVAGSSIAEQPCNRQSPVRRITAERHPSGHKPFANKPSPFLTWGAALSCARSAELLRPELRRQRNLFRGQEARAVATPRW
jgi:hypothetical protein